MARGKCPEVETCLFLFSTCEEVSKEIYEICLQGFSNKWDMGVSAARLVTPFRQGAP